MKNRLVSKLAFVGITLLIGAVAAFAQTVRERLRKEPGFRIYSVVFGITATTNSTVPTVRVVGVMDPKQVCTYCERVMETFLRPWISSRCSGHDYECERIPVA